MDQIQAKKQTNKVSDVNQLENLSKEELIAKIKALESHNIQLRNIIAKSNTLGNVKKKTQQKPFDFATCNFRHIFLKFMYLGWDYHGYAIQEDSTNTIEHYLFEALIKTCLIKDRSSSNYHRCGRTDKGVSSFGQVISINVRSKLPKEEQNDVSNEISYCSILNKVLPDNIQCVAWCPVGNEFSARFDCTRRTYKYFFPKGDLNIEKMQTAATYLLGTHDFRNFCKMDVGNGVVKFVRNILSIDICPCNNPCGQKEYNLYCVTIKGQAFLWHQIRCIMGVLLLIGQDKESPEVVKDLLDIEKNSRKPDYNMASEVPLNLYECEYEADLQWNYDWTSLNSVIQKLQTMWTFSSIKSTMVQQMLYDLHKIQNGFGDNSKPEAAAFIDCLLNGVKTKKYIPLLQRQRCESLENRIEYYVKRQKLEILPESAKTGENSET